MLNHLVNEHFYLFLYKSNSQSEMVFIASEVPNNCVFSITTVLGFQFFSSPLVSSPVLSSPSLVLCSPSLVLFFLYPILFLPCPFLSFPLLSFSCPLLSSHFHVLSSPLFHSSPPRQYLSKLNKCCDRKIVFYLLFNIIDRSLMDF